jgi:hypothetical protein
MTDLCDEDGAEAACELALKSGHDADATCVDVLVQGASLRIIQQRKAEAGPMLQSAIQLILTDISYDTPSAFDLKVSIGKLLLEVASPLRPTLHLCNTFPCARACRGRAVDAAAAGRGRRDGGAVVPPRACLQAARQR